MQKLIDDIKNRVAAVTALKYIDEDWGQLDYYGSGAPVKYPCLLVDLDQAGWDTEGDRTQRGIIRISIRIADMRLAGTNYKAPQSQKTKAGSFFDVMNAVHANLQGWSYDADNGPLTRVLTRKIKRDDGIREMEMIYQVQYMDDSAQPVRSKKRVGVRVVTELV